MRLSRTTLALLAAGALAAWPLAAAAGAGQLAPTYQSSSPDRDAMMDEAPEEVRVTFSEPLDPSSVMNVVDECGNEIDSGPATVQLNEMTVGIGKTPSGMYEVVYRAVGLGDVTGTTASSFEFMVHNGEPCGGDEVEPCKGGHGAHADHRKCDGPRKKREKHRDHRDGERDHGDHDDGMPDHDDHSTTGGSTHSGSHGSTNGGHTGHGGGPMDGGGKHGNHQPPADPPPQNGDFDNPPLASGPGGSPIEADPEAMLIGLGLALAVGVLGGWLLRTSGDLA